MHIYHTIKLTKMYFNDFCLICKIHTKSASSENLQYRSKVSYHRLTRRVSFLSRLVSRNETSLASNETSLVSRKCTGSTNTSLSTIFKPVLCIIVTICAVGTIFTLLSDACVPCVCYKNGNFLQLLAVAYSWILQDTRTSAVGSETLLRMLRSA